jgi:hypothetical protein
VVDYRSQVVAGVNYDIRIKVKNQEDGYLHVKVFKPLPHTGLGPEIIQLAIQKTFDSPFDFSGADVEMKSD